MAPRIGVDTLSLLLGDWADDDGGALPGQLSTALRELIVAGEIPPGARLPSQRQCSRALGLSRGTVAEAYAILAADDVVTSHSRAGTVVRADRSDAAGLAIGGRLTSFSDRVSSEIDLSSGSLRGLPLIADAVDALTGDDVRHLVASDGYLPEGLPALRAGVAADLTGQGIPTPDDHVLITSGAQQGVWLVAQAYVSPGDVVLVEEPTYRGALEVFAAAGARVISVPTNHSGLDIELLARLLMTRRPRLVYCQPTAHNPTGVTMPARNRERLAAALAEHDVLVVEDASSADLWWGPAPPPSPFAPLLPVDQILTISTASKLWWGGLRVGWIRGSPTRLKRLSSIRKTVDLAGALVDQVLLTRLLPSAPAARQARRLELRRSFDVVTALLADLAPTWTWRPPDGGTGLWIDTGRDALELSARGQRNGVGIVAGPAFSSVGGLRKYLRLPLGHPDSDYEVGLPRLLDAH